MEPKRNTDVDFRQILKPATPLLVSPSKRTRRIPVVARKIARLIKSKGWVAGGCLRPMFDPTDEVKDIDVFFKSATDAAESIELLVAAGAVITWQCPIGELTNLVLDERKVQCVTVQYWPTLASLLSHFDVGACRAGIDGDDIFITSEFARGVCQKRIQMFSICYPVASMGRILKYVGKGYKMRPIDQEAWLVAINALDFSLFDKRFYID